MGSCYSKSRGGGSNSLGVIDDGDKVKPISDSKRWNMIGGLFGSGSCEGVQNPKNSQIHVSGKMFSNGASDVACLYTQQGKKGTNQDAMLVWENYNSRRDTVFCGVFDGHGPFGHMVARRVRDSLPLILSTQWNTCSSATQDTLEDAPEATNPDGADIAGLDDQWSETLAPDEENEKLPEMYYPLRQSMLKAFNLMDKELKLHSMIDCFCSGTTAVTLLKQGGDLIIGNVGDSRGILATRDTDNNLVAVQLTVDLKPDLPREAARIERCKGRVFALQDEPEVARVWLPNNDSPGLAMARAFGDFCLKDFGLISVPDIFYHHLTERDEFVILASDGVWDVLSNKEAVDIVSSAPGRSTAARALVDCAVRAWRLKYPNSKNDDCAAVCLFLDQGPPGDAKTRPAARPAPSEPDDSDLQHDLVLERMGTLGPSEIVPVTEEENGPAKSKKSLAECIANGEDEEWSALEGVTRVNSLLSLPRFLSGDSRSASWRKWL